jgi:hypothetical protein
MTGRFTPEPKYPEAVSVPLPMPSRDQNRLFRFAVARRYARTLLTARMPKSAPTPRPVSRRRQSRGVPESRGGHQGDFPIPPRCGAREVN